MKTEATEIVREIQRGEMSREIDESGARGFWDLSRKINEQAEDRQEAIYSALWEVYEALVQ